MNTAQIIVAAFLGAAVLMTGCAHTNAQSPLSSSSPSYEEDDENVNEVVNAGDYGVIESIEMDRGNIDRAGGGAMAEQEIDPNDTQPEPYRIRVKLDNGRTVTITQPLVTALREGDRVRVENNQVYRK